MKKWKQAGWVVAILALMLTTACGGAQSTETSSEKQGESSAEPITLKVADSFPTQHVLSAEGAVYWMKQAEELANGKLKLEYFPAEQLGKAKSLLDAARNRVTDVAYVGVGYVTDKMPLSGVGELPGAANTAQEATKAYWKVVQDVLLEKEFLKNGVRPMYAVIMPPYQIMTTEKPVRTVEDFQGVKARTGGAAQSMALEALGAIPVSMPAPDVYTSLARQTIDGTIFATSSIKPYQIDEMIKYVTVNSNFGGFIVTYCINENVWQSLPKDVQDAMLKAGEMTMEHLSAHLDNLEKTDREELEAKGIEFITMDEENTAKFKQAAETVWDNWAKELDGRGLPGTEVKDAFKAALGKK
ncbi:TRAP transporter substrate-binding protein DctP [Brevibacillus marinus]|uniref:TRAP transporter substrate-binding protein n=1 Tax=Brevibacillus marinus TaxID=2496837 RepID=UPI0013DF3571|nr:TRAP transporter substrate-binding protein DctP [Brevibacillus marinus]